jgi:hypothetical protein
MLIHRNHWNILNILRVYKKLAPIIYIWPVFPIINRTIVVDRIVRSRIYRISRPPSLLSVAFCTK